MSRPLKFWPTFANVTGFCLVALLVYTYFALHLAPVGEISERNWALCDFRDAIYYPCRAVRDGVNPYDVTAYQQHFDGKIGNIFPLYSPLVFVLYFPLAYLPFHAAGWVYQTIQLALLFTVVVLTLRWCQTKVTTASVFGTAALVLLSQPGQTNVNFGQSTWPLVLGSYLALAYSRQQPVWAGLALALASYKPQYALPIGFLLLFRGDFRVLAYGVFFSVLGALAGFALMAAHGVDVLETVNVVLSNQATLQADPTVDPHLTSVRVDVPVFLAKVCGMENESWPMRLAPAVVLLTTGGLVWRTTRDKTNLAPESFATFLLCVGAVVGFYKMVYDLVFLTLPVAALFASRHDSWQRLPTWGRQALRIMAVVLMLNCLWTGPAVKFGYYVRELLSEAWLPSVATTWHFAQTLNPLGLMVAWLLCVLLAVRLVILPEVVRPTADHKVLADLET
jgi:hypothetical protein